MVATGVRHIQSSNHAISDSEYIDQCRRTLDTEGALVLRGFFTPDAVQQVLDASYRRQSEAFFTTTNTHNVHLTPPDPNLAPDHVFNRQITSTKGCLADDQIPTDSPLRDVYDSPSFRSFLCRVLGIDEIYPYADSLSSINVHFHRDGQELGWHFDNSEFAVTLLIRAPEAGGVFEYVPALRDANAGDLTFPGVADVLDGQTTPKTLDFEPGDLVLFRGRNSMHRVTPTLEPTARILVVFAFNTEPDIGLSDSAKETFYGRLR